VGQKKLILLTSVIAHVVSQARRCWVPTPSKGWLPRESGSCRL